MNPYLKFFMILIGICAVYTVIMYHPAIIASLDDDKYIDREVFMPIDGKFDFRKFSLESTGAMNYTTYVCCSGFAQFVDDTESRTINVLEWNKMTLAWKHMENESFSNELKKPSHMVDGIRVIDVVVYDNKRLYAAYGYDESSNTFVYVATPKENETVEMVKTLKFRDF